MNVTEHTSSWATYLALLILPLCVFLPFNFVRFAWGYRNGLKTMPTEVLTRAERVDQLVWPFQHATILGLVILLMVYQKVSATQVGIHKDRWQLSLALGITVGLLLVAMQGLIWKVVPSVMAQREEFENARGSAIIWCANYMVGAFTEELWLVFCLVALLRAGYPLPVAILVPSIAFGSAHFSYRWGALAVAIKGSFSCFLFLATGSFFAPYFFHFLGNVGSLYWALRRAALAR
jgi:membrane protease YdiL (CAAX protease family)